MKLLESEEIPTPIPFMLFPNFTIVYKYLEFEGLLETFRNRTHQEYYVYNNDYYTNEEVCRIENEFKAILRNYEIEDHYDNLLLIVLQNLNKIDIAIDARRIQLMHENRMKELSNLLLAFRRGNDFQITVKEITNKKAQKPAAIKDEVLLKWIASIVENAIKTGVPPQLELVGLLPSKLSLEAASRLKINTVEPKINIYRTCNPPLFRTVI